MDLDIFKDESDDESKETVKNKVQESHNDDTANITDLL